MILYTSRGWFSGEITLQLQTKIEFINHASVLVHCEDTRVLTDPGIQEMLFIKAGICFLKTMQKNQKYVS